MKAHHIIEGSLHDPETLKIIGMAFDDGWAEIAGHFGSDARPIERARLQLAHAVLAVAGTDCRDAEALKNAALQVMAINFRGQLKDSADDHSGVRRAVNKASEPCDRT
jgi:hypothetical protein